MMRTWHINLISNIFLSSFFQQYFQCFCFFYYCNQGLKFGQSKELFSSVPSLINYFKTAVSKRKDPIPVPALAVTSNIDNRNYNKSVTVSGATQNNGTSPQVVKRVSRFAPIASAARPKYNKHRHTRDRWQHCDHNG